MLVRRTHSDFAAVMMRPVLSRRQFLELVGAAGGSAAVYRAATAIGLLPAAARAQTIAVQPLPSGETRTVAVLGAGIGGLAAAYELRRAGYDCVVLEASRRAGGRNMTLRAGDVVDEIGNAQTCRFDSDPDLYFNAGPARIPADHRRLLGYCRALGVRLELFVNENRNAWVHHEGAFGGKPVRNRQYVTDARGFIAEIAAKSVDAFALDEPMAGGDAEKLFDLLRAFGDLDADAVYRGSARAAYESGGMLVPGIKRGVFDLAEIVAAGFWRGPLNFGEQEFQVAPMMQPVGGMDRIVDAFVAELGQAVVLGAPVRSIRLGERDVEIVYERDGETRRLVADYCLNSIPLNILAGIEHNFPRDYAAALAAVPPGRLFKIGLQASRRFWEDEDIYGGISWTSQDISQIWYPSHGIFSRKGIVLGAYTFGDDGGTKFAKLTPDERIETAIRQGERIHPAYRQHIENGVSIVWHRIDHILGCSARWNDELIERHFAMLQAPAGRHYLIGDQISLHPGWQEGALASAHEALQQLDARVAVEPAPARA